MTGLVACSHGWRTIILRLTPLFVALVITLGATSVSAAAVVSGATAAAHKGWMLQAGTGVGISSQVADWGVALPNITVGRYVRRNVAVAAHVGGTSHLHRLFGAHAYDFALIFYGPLVQWWCSDWVYLAAGWGLATYVQSTPLPRQGYTDSTGGVAMAFKVGATPAVFAVGRLNIVVEAIPAFFNLRLQAGLLAALEWQVN